MKKTGLFCLCLSFGSAASAAKPQTPPPLPQTPGYALAVQIDYANDADARALWQPMQETAPVSVVQAGPRKALRLPCNFAGTKMPRASWDGAVKIDAALSRGIRFRFYCADPDPISNFTVYFHSGDGWYSAPFSLKTPDAWNVIEIEKSATRIEDAPGGWGAIDTIRVSAWRDSDKNTECYIADFGLLDSNVPIAIVRNESALAKGRGEDDKSIEEYTQSVDGLLQKSGLCSSILSDLDLSAASLKSVKAVILPFCPSLSDAAVASLASYVARGGKLVSFYTLPDGLCDAAGFKKGAHIKQREKGDFASIRSEGLGLKGLPPAVEQTSWNIQETLHIEGRSRIAATWYNAEGRPTGHAAILVSDNAAHMTHIVRRDDRANKALLVLAMVGHVAPEVWKTAAQSSLERAGVVGPYRSFTEAVESIGKRAGKTNVAARSQLDKAVAARDEAARLLKADKYPESIVASANATGQILQAFCSIQQPKLDEHRAFWCHDAFGVAGMTWDEAIGILADNGFTAIFPNMLWGGLAYYKSAVLPVAEEVQEKGDQIEQCLAACRKYGVECHVWKVNWNMDGRAPKEFEQAMRQAGRVQVSFNGASKEPWLCPSNPANQQLEIDTMVEVATKYDVDGIHFDYIRYPNQDGCFCDGCRRRFELAIGAKVANWPKDVRKDSALEQKWFDFRRKQINTVVAAVSERTRKVRPRIKFSAAVFSDWERDRDRIGQDWKLWLEKGWLDFVCPMDYTEDNAEFEKKVRRQIEWAGKSPCYPGIGLSTWSDSSDIVKLIEQIEIARRLGARGFNIFQFSASEARDIAPLCGKGITRR